MPSLPLSLYVHFPWCIRKCPYCDFNSHTLRQAISEDEYVDALLADLENDLPLTSRHPITSIFIGGGTPSLLSVPSLERLIVGIDKLVDIDTTAEITLEANPGTVDQAHFRGYWDAGVNRLSIGIQSFNDNHLKRLGRIHDQAQARTAIAAAKNAGFAQINLDLMYGLPGQTLEDLHNDLNTAIHQEVCHVSFYQLTIEPNTEFAHRPPQLPDSDTTWLMQHEIDEGLGKAGYEHYEVSAYAKPGAQCRHNLNYWEFGDYLGIGAGAHGKLTGPNGVTRYWKLRHPREYLRYAGSNDSFGSRQQLANHDLVIEFMMNTLRLSEGFLINRFAERTGLTLSSIEPQISLAIDRGLVAHDGHRLRATSLGQRFLNDLLGLFLMEPATTNTGSGNGH